MRTTTIWRIGNSSWIRLIGSVFLGPFRLCEFVACGFNSVHQLLVGVVILEDDGRAAVIRQQQRLAAAFHPGECCIAVTAEIGEGAKDRKSTRLNSSHSQISYAVFCLKKKNAQQDAAQHLVTRQRGALLVTT